MCRLYVAVSGQIRKVRDYLSGKKGVVTWNALEDMALGKPDQSIEFQVLLEAKGREEITIRRTFLAAKARYEQLLE